MCLRLFQVRFSNKMERLIYPEEFSTEVTLMGECKRKQVREMDCDLGTESCCWLCERGALDVRAAMV